MMERRRTQPTLMDGYISELGDPRIRAKLARLDKAVPWERLARPIQATYRNGAGKGGRPNIPVTMMLKVVMLQKWFIERRVRGQGELTKAQKAHNRLCASFRAFVEHPFAWMKRFGGLARTRYRGLRHNAQDFALAAIAYDFERSLSLNP